MNLVCGLRLREPHPPGAAGTLIHSAKKAVQRNRPPNQVNSNT
jgi:hypothetical protein